MLEKAISEIDIKDLEQLRNHKISEGQRLEFKKDLSSSDEEDHISNVSTSLTDEAKTKLAAEIVAFANADGGVLILGIDEIDEKPNSAGGLFPIPDIFNIENKLGNFFLSNVEPRIPYCELRAISVEGDSGILIIKVAASPVAPHWVKLKRGRTRATIRRDDKCVPLTMFEVHAMARRNGDMRDQHLIALQDERSKFGENIARYIRNYEKRGAGYTASIGLQVTIIPHWNPGLPRLESLELLVGDRQAVNVISNGGPEGIPSRFANAKWQSERILGGAEWVDDAHLATGHAFERSRWLRAMRDGRVIAGAYEAAQDPNHAGLPIHHFVDCAAVALNAYDRLTRSASAGFTGATITADLIARGSARLAIGDTWHSVSPRTLADGTSAFPRYEFVGRDQRDLALNELAGDFTNAAGFQVPKERQYASARDSALDESADRGREGG